MSIINNYFFIGNDQLSNLSNLSNLPNLSKKLDLIVNLLKLSEKKYVSNVEKKKECKEKTKEYKEYKIKKYTCYSKNKLNKNETIEIFITIYSNRLKVIYNTEDISVDSTRIILKCILDMLVKTNINNYNLLSVTDYIDVKFLNYKKDEKLVGYIYFKDDFDIRDYADRMDINVENLIKKRVKRIETDICEEQQFQIKKKDENKQYEHILKILENKRFYEKTLLFLNKEISKKLKKNIGNIYEQKYYFTLKIRGYNSFFCLRYCP